MTRPRSLSRSAAAAFALTAALLFTAACSDDEEPAVTVPSPAASVPAAASDPAATGPAGTAPAPAPPSGTVPIPQGTGPAGGNAQQVCDTVTKDSSAAVMEYVGQLSKLAQAGPDTADGKAAQAAAEKALDGWEASLRTQAGAATDARLKAVLTNMAAQVSTMTADLNAIGGGQVEQLQAMLDELCGG
ncbi:hypothetical protein J2S43_000029 [Catenuloplanes nepalensis]|uniref:Lipoprotein n=1 Tax=Catenuloplanes nepalensis TaxID=587533 RepID=A0ABT9MJB0_9ACTN|nr:hypothetical protein [Catenuloplanes nepalensis]MDP9791517.1 hypothetical protein [Catenuloplanes nepalensis]